MNTPEDRDAADGMWQVVFDLGDAPALEVLEVLEDMALSASIVETESDDDEMTIAWRVELMFGHRPDIVALEAEIAGLLAPFELVPSAIELAFLPHENWLSQAAMPRSTLELGRFTIHGAGGADGLQPGRVSLLIEAGMAFGSGEHGSTSGCLLMLDELLQFIRPKTVLDMGCGSAILAIAAAKTLRRQCGGAIVASDNDPVAVRVAAENMRQNGVGTRVRAVHAEGYASALIRRAAPYDLIFANILADPLCAMAADLRRHIAPGGHAILAGLLNRQAAMVIDAHEKVGLHLVRRLDLSPWTTLMLRRPGRGRHLA